MTEEDLHDRNQRRANADYTIQCDGGGLHVLWYCDDDNNSGYGGHAEEARWYAGRNGTREDCIARGKQPPPVHDEDWVRISSEGSPPYDAATATGMYDGW